MASKSNLISQQVLESPYGTFEDVEYNLKRYDNLINGIKSQGSIIITELTNELQELLVVLQSQESSFYNLMGTSDSEKAMSVLNQKIEDWNKGGANLLLEKKTVDDVFDMMIEQIDDAAVIRLLQNYISRHQKAFNNIVRNSVEEDIGPLITQLFEDKHTFKRGSSLGAQLSVSKKGRGSYTISELGENTKLSKGIKTHLLTLISQEVPSTKVSERDIQEASDLLKSTGTVGNITDKILEYLKARISNGEVYRKIATEINNEKGYARWANYFVIQGYFGEVYWNAFMNFLFQGRAWVAPIGDIKNMRGKSMAVDMLVNGIGFQIKKWSLKTGVEGEEMFQNHTNEKEVKFGTFLSSGAEILNHDIGEVIARMFGSLSYNIPVVEKNANEKTEGREQSYSDLYQSLHKTSNYNMHDLELLFQTKIHKIIGISGVGGISISGNQYFNTFWAINDKIIPSSIIIEELIEQVKKVQPTQLVSFELLKMTDRGGPTWYEKTDFSDYAMANRWKIKYATRFNLTKILNSVAKRQ